VAEGVITASRRDVLVGAGGGLAALQFGLTPASAQTVASPLFLFDSSIQGTVDAARIAADAGLRTRSFRHDIGEPWFDTIEPLWRHSPTPVAGVTFGGAFFCLEHLARSHRLTCTARSALPAGRDLGPATTALLRLAMAGSPSHRPQGAEYGDAPVLWLLQPIRPTL
jgi:hypothetical protein